MNKYALLNPWVSHFIVFILGAAAIFPYDLPCELDLKGIAVELTTKQKQELNGYQRSRPIYPLQKLGDSACLLSKEAFFLFESDSKLWALFPRKKTSIDGIKAFVEGKVNLGSHGVDSYARCDDRNRVTYE